MRSSSKHGCDVLDALGEDGLDPDLGIGIGCEPSQKPHVPLVSQANLIPRRHLEYSAPVAWAERICTPGRRVELSVNILLKRKAAAALRREAGWSVGKQRDIGPLITVVLTNKGRPHACWTPSRLYAACFEDRSARSWATNRSLGLQNSCLDFRVSEAMSPAGAPVMQDSRSGGLLLCC